MTRSGRQAGPAWPDLLLWLVAVPCLAGGAVLALLRLGSPSSARAVELVALTPLGVPLCGAALLALAVLALRTRGRRRLYVWGSFGLGLPLIVAHGYWVAPLFTGSAPGAARGRPLVVMTQNLESGNAEVLARRARETGAGILVVTDSVPGTLHALLATGIRRQLPHAVGVGDAGPEGSVVLSRYPLRADRAISDGADSRAVRVEVPGLGSVELVALHPTPPYQGMAWTHDHDRIARFLDRRYDGGRAADRPALIVGDLNATLDHAPVRHMEDLGFRDAVEEVNGGFRPTWPKAGTKTRFGVPVPPLLQLDHVLVSGALVVTGVSEVATPGADHLGLVATVRAAA